jgi:hypothetical protein
MKKLTHNRVAGIRVLVLGVLLAIAATATGAEGTSEFSAPKQVVRK